VSAFSETFTIVSRGVTGQDADGNDVYGETQTTTTGAFAPQGSAELIQGQATVLTHDTIYLDDGAPTPDTDDQVIARGLRYDIDGTPGVFHNPHTGRDPGPVLRLLRVTG
jgi:hypothetical protein